MIFIDTQFLGGMVNIFALKADALEVRQHLRQERRDKNLPLDAAFEEKLGQISLKLIDVNR